MSSTLGIYIAPTEPEYRGPRSGSTHAPQPFSAATTYTVATWDHEPGGPPAPGFPAPPGDWHIEMKGVPLWALRGWLRELYSRGYDRDLSILVERED